jgi:transposase
MTGYMDFVTSSGGPSTKIHALVDALGNPLAFLLTPGQAHDLVGAVSIENRLDGPPIVLGAWAGIANFPRKQVIRSRRHRTAPRELD